MLLRKRSPLFLNGEALAGDVINRSWHLAQIGLCSRTVNSLVSRGQFMVRRQGKRSVEDIDIESSGGD
ncbi:Hypothetical predicted protein [Octopus vulgaris]|uniref:Uncharacterized protein n=1 Tax=Octopus vulgaris TaxID=6645 RepID=A0AA36BT12_OCTVU|nr:Hypothetical predicted protein [Octopus vulgaris]